MGAFIDDGGIATIELGAGNLTAGYLNGDDLFAGVINGTGSVTKVGTGTWTLSGVNTYTGGTNINGGTIAASADNNLGASSGGLSFNSLTGTLRYLASFDTARAITLNSLGGRFDTNGFDSTLSGNISGVGTLHKWGAGTLTLSAANTYTGHAIINEGVLRLGNALALQHNSIYLYVDDGLDLNGFDATIGALDGTGNLNLGSTALTAGGNNGDTIYSGIMSGAGSLTKTGTGIMTLSGANTFTGGLTIDNGTIRLGASGVLADTCAVVVNSPGVFDLNGEFDWIGSLAGSGSVLLGSVGAPLYTGYNNASTTYSGVMSGYGLLVKVGTGIFTISGANTYTAGTYIGDGTLRLGASGVLADTGNVVVSSPGVFELNGYDETIGSLSGSGNVSLAGAILTAGGNHVTGTYSGVMSGSGGLVKTGIGTLTLSGANTFTGGLTIDNGTIRLGADHVISNDCAVTVNSSGVFDVNGRFDWIGSLAGSGSVQLPGTSNLITGADNTSTTFSGVISGTGYMQKQGTGVMTLSGANSFTGGLWVQNGTLRLGASNVLADTLAMYLNNPGVFDVNGYTERVGSIQGAANVTLGGGTLYAGGLNGSTTYSGVMSGTGGSFIKEGTGYMYMTGTNTYTGETTVAGGRLFVNGSLQGHATVNSGAGLNGTGTVYGGVTNNGEISPEASYSQIGTLGIGNNYVQGSGGMYRANIMADGSCDWLQIEGTATLDGTLSVASLGGTYGLVTNYTLLTASGGLGGTTFSGYGDNLPTYLDPYVNYDANNVTLQLIRNDVNFGAMGGTYNQRSVGNALSNELQAANMTILPLLEGVYNLPASRQPAALGSLAGEVHTAVAQSSLGFLTSFMNTVNARMAQARGDMRASAPSTNVLLASADEGMTDAGSMYSASVSGSSLGLWIKGYGLFGDTDSDGNAHGYDYTTGGTVAGLEFDNGAGLVLGLGGGYGVTELSLDGTADGMLEDGGVKSTQATVYAGYRTGPVYVDVAGGYAYNRYDTKRHISLTGANASAAYTGDEYSAMVETGYGLGLMGLDVMPLVSFQWTRLDTDGFTETGAGTANLSVEERSSDSLKYGAGLKLAKNYTTSGGWSVVPELRGKWTHESGNNDQTIDASFASGVGGTFSVHGLDIGRDKAEVGAGFSVFRARGISLALDYDAEINEEQTAHAFTGEVKYMW